MTSDRTSWPFTVTSLAALRDELTKIAAEKNKKTSWTEGPAGGILAAGVGTGLGTGAYLLAQKKFPNVFLHRNENLAPAMKFLLPITGAAASYGAYKLRQRLNEHYKKAKGYVEPTE